MAIKEFIINHPILSAASIPTIYYVYHILLPHRGCWKELKNKGLADVEKRSVFAFKLFKSVILTRFNRSRSRTELEQNLSWFSEIYGENFVAVSEWRWLRYLGFKSWMRLLPLKFPLYLKVKQSNNKDIINFGKNSFHKTTKINLRELGLILASGRSGSGKTFFSKKIVEHFKKFKMKTIISTPKIFDFVGYDVVDTEKSLEEIQKKLEEVLAITENRKARLLEQQKVHARDLKEDNDYILIVLDEAYQILGTTKDQQKIKIQQMVNYLVRTGRAYGVITLLLTQKLVKGELGETNLRDGYVISGKQDTSEASTAAFGTDIATQDFLKDGVMVFRNFEKTEVIKVAK